MLVMFRTDTSTMIGTGHVMRCLTLADGLADAGGVCFFLTRAHDNNMIETIRACGHEVTAIPAGDSSDYGEHPAAPVHAAWLGSPWRTDADATLKALADMRPDWLIVDHYALDAHWEQMLRPACERLAVIDDLADRPHDADLLLDQNLGRKADDYAGLISTDCRLLIGPQHTLLRPEFTKLRPRALARHEGDERRRLLVTLGGIDKDNVTGAVLEALTQIELPEDMTITVVMGISALWLADIRSQAMRMPRPTRVLINVSNMAELMTESDICIGAAGSTAWECCALGLPTLLIVTAENQRVVAKALVAEGATTLIGDLGEFRWRKDLPDAIGHGLERSDLIAMANAASKVVDGAGAPRVVSKIIQLSLKFRRSTEEDCERVWTYREHDEAWRFYRAGRPTSLEEHKTWYAKAINDPRRCLIIVELADEPIAHLRFDIDGAGARVNIYLAPEKRGKGLGETVLRQANCFAARKNWTHLSVDIHEKNTASLRIFERCGYRPVGKAETFVQLSHLRDRVTAIS